MKCGDHEFRRLFLVKEPKMGPKGFSKVHFWRPFFLIEMAFSSLDLLAH